MHQRVSATGDSGVTMIELFVAMIIMTIAGSIFVGAVVTLFRTTNQAQAITGSATSTNQAYQALDKTVRYASAISLPGRGTITTKDWYVELSDTTSGSEVCTQLRVDITTKQLQRRTWTVGSPAALPDFTPIASNITNGDAVAGEDSQPFFLEIAPPDPRAKNPTVQNQQLTFTLASVSGPSNGRVTSKSEFTLAALNSSTGTPRTGAICPQVRP
jgi:type II secretory pathway pseudopilin PulG